MHEGPDYFALIRNKKSRVHRSSNKPVRRIKNGKEYYSTANYKSYLSNVDTFTKSEQ